MTTATVSEALLTAEEYANLPDNGVPTELVAGKVVEMNVPTPRHGEICVNVSFHLRLFFQEHPSGRVVSNDSGVITRREPDTVRGPDLSYYSYARIPQGPLPRGYLNVVPELVFEVRSPLDRWPVVLAKVAEYLQAGVTAVCVLDQITETCTVYRDEELPRTLRGEERLLLPDILPGFEIAVSRFFE